MPVPDLNDFLRLTEGKRRLAITHDVLADVETPVSAYWKLAHDQVFSFLLESVTGGEQLARYSIIGVRPKEVLRSKGAELRRVTVDGQTTETLSRERTPLDALREAMGEATAPVPGLPLLTGGAVGMLAYDMVRWFERLPDQTQDDNQVDDMAMMLVDTVVVFDHAKNLIRIVATAEPSEEGYTRASAEIDWILARLQAERPALPSGAFEVHEVQSNVTQERYEAMVQRVKEYVTAGDGQQMVPSQRFSTRVDAHPLTLYRALRSINPSPYMFLFRFGDFDIVGASPELHCSLIGRTARLRPIAGTRWRGQSEEEDQRLADELLADEKERAEHVMLVDLGRNDLGRVCEYGSVKVNQLMVIERYSHVMHIVSDVTGTLRNGKDALDLFAATFPAGTVSGAPKVRAMEIIDELEPTRRGLYAGAVGFLSHSGDFETCIALRTMLIKDGVAYVQAGAGVVYDSVPTKEYEETKNKAKAALAAIALAQRGL